MPDTHFSVALVYPDSGDPDEVREYAEGQVRRLTVDPVTVHLTPVTPPLTDEQETLLDILREDANEWATRGHDVETVYRDLLFKFQVHDLLPAHITEDEVLHPEEV